MTGRALILDDESAGLGPVALALLRLGIDVFYATDGDEARLLCAQPEVLSVRALVVPESVPIDAVGAVAGRLATRLGASVFGRVVVGDLADEARCARLRKQGVEWALRTPFDDSTLRWVLNAAMAAGHREGQRQSPRVPTTLHARALVDERRKDLLLSTLSANGAFLETPLPLPSGTRLELEIPLPDGPLRVQALVARRHEAGRSGPAALPCGMGVAFSGLDEAASGRLKRFVAERARHFSL